MKGTWAALFAARRSAAVCSLLSVGLGLVLCTVPRFGVMGVDSAFVLGLITPLLAAVHMALVHGYAQRQGTALDRLTPLFATAARLTALHVGLPTLLLALNALRTRPCEPALGLLYIALGPGLGTGLATLLAACLCHLAHRQRHGLRLLLASVGPILGLVAFAHNFYDTPAVFAYGHFFGHFPGALYDELVSFPTPWLWLRLGTLTLGAGLVLVLCGQQGPNHSLRLRPSRPGLSGLGIALVAVAVALECNGEKLGFATSASYIQAQLGEVAHSKRCQVYLPREYALSDRQRFLDDCDVRVRQMEQFFGLQQRRHVQVYLFRNAAEKQRLMGAAHTNIAKPWRNEVYVQRDTFPHPILAHEIAHVVVGNAGVGPFRVAGRWFGLWPNPGIVEGMATAADPRPRGDLTPHQWARAAQDAGLAPPLAVLLGTGFFQQQTQLAYTLAGSFLLFMRAEQGRGALLRFYQSSDPEIAFGAPLNILAQRWQGFLARTPMPVAAAALAKQRFSGDPVLSAVCPHQVAGLKEALQRDLASGDLSAAETQCARILAIDQGDDRVAAARVRLLARQGKLDQARAALAALKQTAPAALVAMTQQSLADALVRRSQYDLAEPIYRELLLAPQTQDSLRLLEVKLVALKGSPQERNLLFRLLVGGKQRPTDPLLALYLARELRRYRNDGLPFYLEARQLYHHGHGNSAIALLERSLRLGLPTATLQQEAQRMLGIALVANGDLVAAKALWTALRTQGNAALRWHAEDFLTRIQILTADAAAASH